MGIATQDQPEVERGEADQGIARRVTQLMGMPISVALRGAHARGAEADDAWAQVTAALADVDRVFSPYRPTSWVSRLSRGEVDELECPPELREVLALGDRARRDSGGAFDVRRGGVLDPSGVVKGWAVERASLPLSRLEDTDFCLSAGGDLVAHSSTDPWRIGIEDPHDPARVVAVVPVMHGAVATSGLAHRGAHITDARTGRTPTALASVTVVADSLVRADIDATAAFALGDEGPCWLRSRPGAVGLVVYADGRRERFEGIAAAA
jgi:FAD:protein FMN transferase